MIKDIWILGSGPVGLIASYYLLEKGYKVNLVDNSKSRVDKENLNKHNITFKDISNNIFSNNFLVYFNSNIVLPISSKSAGGFTKVWGGTLNIFNNEELRLMNINQSLIEKYKFILDKLKLDVDLEINPNNSVKNFNKSIYDKSVIDFYEKIIKNNSYLNQEDIEITLSSIFLKNGKIWSSDILINEMSTEYGDNFLHISDFEVSSIEEEKDYINLISNDGNQIKIENSKLFLASGVLTSSVLLTKSINTSFFEIRDSKLIAMPLLKIGKNTKEKSKNTYSQIFINFNDSKNSKSIIRTQLYILNKELIDSVSGKLRITKTLLYGIEKIFRNRIFISFIYSNSENSDYFHFNIDNKNIEVFKKIKKINKDFKIVFLKLLKSFNFTHLIPIPIFKTFPMYGSFHHGAFKAYKSFEKEEISLNEKGQIYNNSNIFVLDSSNIKYVPSGPITFTVMANALNIVDNAIK